MNRPPRWQADLALAMVALIWGSTFVVVKRALEETSAVSFLAWRFGLASLCLLLFFLPGLVRAERRSVHEGLRGGCIVGVLLWVGYLLQTIGLEYTTAGKSGFLTGLYIVLVPFLGALVYRRWPRVRELAALGVAGAGLVIMTLPSIGGPLRINRGDLLTIGCAVAFAGHLLLLAHYSKRGSVQAIALGQVGMTALLSIGLLATERMRGVSLPFAQHSGAGSHWSANLILALVLTAILATALAFIVQTWGQKYTTATRTALIFALEPVFALATAVLIGNEPLTASAVTGGALILSGVLLVELKPTHSHLKPDAAA